MNKRAGIFLVTLLFLIIPLYTIIHLYGQQPLIIRDQQLSILIDIKGIDLKAALDEDNPIIIDPDKGVNISLQYTALNTSGIEIDKLRTVFLFADFDIISQTDELDFTLRPEDNFTYFQTWKFQNFLGIDNIDLISGKYKVRYDIYYSDSAGKRILRCDPFYIKFSGNPFVSVPSIVASIAVVQAGASVVSLVQTMRGSVSKEFENSIGATKISPTKKLIGYYRGSTYSRLQAEVSKSAFGYATNLSRGGKCPQCKQDWPENQKECIKCKITFNEAVELYSQSLSEKSLRAAQEVVNSVSGLSLSNIAQKLGDGVVPTSSIISVLTFSGLTLVQPRIGKSWRDNSRKLVFRSLRIAIYSLFWIQATGVDTVSMVTLIIVILSGFILPTIFSTILSFNIRGRVRSFWESQQSSTISQTSNF